MNHRRLLDWLVLLACGMWTAATAGADRTNLVLVMTDDQAVWSLGCYGNHEARTPEVDRLAREGMRFTRAFATSPVCSPSRATFFTGRIPSQHGIHDWIKHENMGPRARYCLDDEVLLSEILADNDYTCGMSGKWHLGDSLHAHAKHSFWYALPRGASVYNDADMIWQEKVVKTAGYLTDRITDKAVEFIDANRDRPFFLNVSYNAPHSPFKGHPAELVDAFMDCPFISCPDLPAHPWAVAQVSHYRTHPTLSQYFAACSGISRGVGRLMDRLDELGLSENTLFVYASDQGFNCGHHGLWGKGNASNPRNMYDTSLQIPLIFRQPGRVPAGAECNVLLSAYDFLPTVLAHLGLPTSPEGGPSERNPSEPNLPGRSFAPVLRGDAMESPEAIYAEYARTRMIRTATHKYIHRTDGGPHELYDLENDPGETTNLVGHPDQDQRITDLVVSLRSRLFKWFEQHAEVGSDPVGNEYLR